MRRQFPPLCPLTAVWLTVVWVAQAGQPDGYPMHYNPVDRRNLDPGKEAAYRPGPQPGSEAAPGRSVPRKSRRGGGQNRVVCKLIPLRTGVCRLGKDHLLGEGHSSDQRKEFALYAFLVEGPNRERALVDLGPKTVGYLNRMFRTYGFFRDLGPEVPPARRYPDDIVQPEGNVLRQLAQMNISAETIDHLVFTHLHSDHHGMDDARGGGAAEDFPRATLHVSAVGWQDNLDKRTDGKWNSYVDYAFGDFLLKREKEGRVRFEDNARIFPGMRTIYLGGHSVCSQGVVVATEDGPVILASDDVYLYELLEADVLPRIRTSETRYRRAVDRLVDLAVGESGIIIPLHDPIVWETYKRAGPDWLKQLRKHSDRAIEGYLKIRKTRRK